MRARAIRLGSILGAVTALAPRPASADAGPKWQQAVFLPVGVNLGAAIHPKATSGFLLGGEVSALYIDSQLRWIGGYTDVLHDFAAAKTRFSLGPELGWTFVGLDGGYVGQLGQGRYHHGVNARLVVTIAFLGVYGRFTHIFDDPLQPNFAEVGALIKIPIPLYEKRLPRGPSEMAPPPPAPPPDPRPLQSPPTIEAPAQPVAPTPEPQREFATPPPSPVAPTPPRR